MPLALLTPAGHAMLEPVQLSAASHSSAAARQTAPALPAGCVQATLLPSHWSSVQALDRKGVVEGMAVETGGGQATLEPVQRSAGAHSLAGARQAQPAG